MNNKYQNVPNVSEISEEEIKMLTENIDAVYIYLDLYIDSMNQEEVNNWKEILELIDKLEKK